MKWPFSNLLWPSAEDTAAVTVERSLGGDQHDADGALGNHEDTLPVNDASSGTISGGWAWEVSV